MILIYRLRVNKTETDASHARPKDIPRIKRLLIISEKESRLRSFRDLVAECCATISRFSSADTLREKERKRKGKGRESPFHPAGS